jgi:hypothetical protein
MTRGKAAKKIITFQPGVFCKIRILRLISLQSSLKEADASERVGNAKKKKRAD